MIKIGRKWKQAISIAVLGAVALSIPMTTDAKRIHDPKVETKAESRHLSDNNKTVNLTPENRSSNDSANSTSSRGTLQERIDAILNSRQREKELLGQNENVQ